MLSVTDILRKIPDISSETCIRSFLLLFRVFQPRSHDDDDNVIYVSVAPVIFFYKSSSGHGMQSSLSLPSELSIPTGFCTFQSTKVWPLLYSRDPTRRAYISRDSIIIIVACLMAYHGLTSSIKVPINHLSGVT